MTAKRVPIIMSVLTLGCGGGSEPAITTSEVVGTWTIVLTEEPACGRNNPAPTLTLYLTVLGETGATRLTLMGQWELGPVVNPRSRLEGEVDLETGNFSAELWREPVPGNPAPESRARLMGTIIDYGSLTAELDDPVPGASGILGAGSAATGPPGSGDRPLTFPGRTALCAGAH